jgi:outer membrane usher protein
MSTPRTAPDRRGTHRSHSDPDLCFRPPVWGRAARGASFLAALSLALQPLAALAPQLRTGGSAPGDDAPPLVGEEPRSGLILSYRLAPPPGRNTRTQPARPAYLGVAIQGVRLRQETRIGAAMRKTQHAAPRNPGAAMPVVRLRQETPIPAKPRETTQHGPPGDPEVAVDGLQLRLEPRISAGVREQDASEELILTIRANGVSRGDFTLLRRADGDFWLAAEDLPRLKFEPREPARRQLGAQPYFSIRGLGAPARRQLGAQPYFSIRGLGATSLAYDEAQLALSLVLPVQGLEGSVIDLSNRPPAVTLDEPGASLILGYRLAVRTGHHSGPQYVAESDANVRVHGVLLRQETRFDADAPARRFVRGRSQAVYDDRANARRYIAGDALSTAGAYGSAITGGGLLLRKLYDLTPDALTQPAATFRTSSTLPAEVEVAVDGATISRTSVNPGPITVSNLLLNGGSRTVRVTITDASGRREVIEQPFLFTDSVLAQGLHEYSYFVGKRSELRGDHSWHYLDAAWQGFHRYGVSDQVTVSGGGEGSGDFANGGAGLTLRNDLLGLFSADLLGSHDRQRGTTAAGWSARYTYISPNGALVVGRRQFEQGFRTFTTGPTLPFLRRETRVAVSTRVWAANVSADLVRSEDEREVRDTGILRLATQLARGVSLSAEYQKVRVNGRPDWAVNVFLRTELGGPYWAGAVAHVAPGLRSVDLETGKQIDQGEGFGYRVGTNFTRASGADIASTFLSANWNLRSAGLELFANQPWGGGGSGFAEAAVAGAIVGVDGSFGLSRQVSDSFVLARLGVPLPGVDIYLNNQVQGTTDDQGKLFIPDVGAFGRQDVSVNDKQVPMQYNLAQRRRTVTPPYRSGTVVDFGGARVRAVAGMAWQLRGGRREPIPSRAWDMSGAAGRLRIETGQAGDFYLENAAPGHYAGKVDLGARVHACKMDVPDFAEAVHELERGIVCD